MAIVIYELDGRDGHRFSPYCWRTRMALAHKGLTARFETIPFRDKSALAFANHKTVPVLVDGGKTVVDSWSIAEHLECYPGRTLFGRDGGRTFTRFINAWTNNALQRALAPLIVADIFAHATPEDREHFRATREPRYGGRRLEDVQAEARADGPDAFRSILSPVRDVVAENPYLGGDEPLYADYIVLGAFQWARCVSSYPLLSEDDPVHAWRGRMLKLYDGMAAKVPGYPC